MTTRNHTTTPGFSRRRLLQGTARLGGAAATIAAIRAAFPSGAFAEGSGPETAKVALGKEIGRASCRERVCHNV